jgi:hypothetical protein
VQSDCTVFPALWETLFDYYFGDVVVPSQTGEKYRQECLGYSNGELGTKPARERRGKMISVWASCCL